MKKQFYCLFLVLFFAISWGESSAANNDDGFSGCCKPPVDKTITCDQLPYDFDPHDIYQLQSLFGRADNRCFPGVWTELPPTVNLNICESGTIVRHFQASNNYGSYDECEQTVTILGVHQYKIRFPADLDVTCGVIPENDQVIQSQASCDYLVVSVEDQKFFNGNSQCGEIFRTYRLINWCEYDGQSLPVVVGRDEDCDGKPGDEDVWVIRRYSGTTYIDRDNDETNSNPSANERTTCTPANPTGYWRTSQSVGYWQYTQHISISDDTPPTVTITQPQPFCSYSNTCDAKVDIPFSVDDACTPNDIKIKVFVDGVKIAEYAKGGNYLASGTFVIGSHNLEIHAIDGCGNPTVQSTTFSVVDCKAPAPTCLNGVTVTLMPLPPDTDADGDGSIDAAATTIWATDLLVSQISDCSGIAGFSINRVGETPSIDKKGLIITCNDLGTLDVEVYAWDKANNPYAVQPDSSIGGPNYTFCKTYILVQINNNSCDTDPGMGVIAGQVLTENNHGLQDVNIMLAGRDSTFQGTNISGSFRFENVPMRANYKIIPGMNTNPLEGLSVVDLILLQKHVLGIERIRSPYHLIAADINHDDTITDADVSELRDLLLGVQTNFSHNTSWRFIDASFVFPNPINPWQTPFPEYIAINQMSSAENYGSFIAIKTGDINSSIIEDRQRISSRSHITIPLNIPAKTLQAGDIVEVPVRADFSEVEASEFALQFDSDKLQLLSIDPGIFQSKDIFVDKAKGVINTVWNQLNSSTEKSDALFTLTFKANDDVSIANAIHLNNERIEPIAYQYEAIAQLSIEFVPDDLNERFALYQNTPNPFRDQTTIAFELPEAINATIQVFDLNGKVLWQRKGTFAKGYNQIAVDSKAISASGVLLYSLKTADYRAVKKMVVLP